MKSMSVIPILLAVLALALVVCVFMVLSSRSKSLTGSSKKRLGSNDAIIRNAERRLESNPNDPEALYNLAETCFEEENWERALKTYETLIDVIGASPPSGTNSFEIYLHYGITAQKLNLYDKAYKGFSVARNFRQDNFDVNYGLGAIEFERKNYEKAIQFLQKARTQDPENAGVLRIIGHSLFRMKKAKEAMSFIRMAIDLAPDDKESLYTLAECYSEANQNDQALRIFSHLRADPVMGPSACLAAGTIRSDTRQFDAAIQDFEIGLKHQNIRADILAELRYRLATNHIKKNEIGKAMHYLKQLQLESPSYKDVNVLVTKYQELNANRNLQVFLMSSSADFVALCRRLVLSYFPKAKVKITNISVHKNEWADILAEVDTPKWSDLIMFRFIRTQGSVGELIVRDFHSHIKEVKAGKGICITVGNFSEEAKRYTEARLIDLIEKDKLSIMLNTIDGKIAAATSKRS